MPIDATHTPLTGLRRVLNSAKVQAAASGTAVAYVACRYAAPTLAPDQRAYLWIAFLGGLFWMIREVLNAWAVEDAALKSVTPPTPTVQVNTGTQAANVQQPAMTDPRPVGPIEPDDDEPRVAMKDLVAAINTIGRRVKALETQPPQSVPTGGKQP